MNLHYSWTLFGKEPDRLFLSLKNDEHFYRNGVLELLIHPIKLIALIIHS